MKRATEVYKELIPRLRRVLGENDDQVLLAENNYGYMLMSSANYAEAEPVFEEVIRRSSAISGGCSANHAWTIGGTHRSNIRTRSSDGPSPTSRSSAAANTA